MINRNKCCDADRSVQPANETLSVIKAECMKELRKSRKNVTEKSDEVEGNGGLYNMFSCEKINRWKTTVTCTMDCFAMKIGVVMNGNLGSLTSPINFLSFNRLTWKV
jgi:hypothetical protein